MVIGVGIAAFVFMPAPAEAHDLNEDVLEFGYWGGGANPIIPCTGIFDIPTKNGVVRPAPAQTAGLETCKSLCDILHALQHLIYFALTILIFIIVPGMIFVGGGIVLVSAGNPGTRSTGLSTIKSAIIGLAIALGAFLIVNTFLWLIFNNTGSSSIYTYTGDALSGATSTRGTEITWPIISCAPGNYNPFVPTPGSERAETSAAECERYCTNQAPPRTSNYNASGTPKCTCGDPQAVCLPRCSASEDCKKQSDNTYKCEAKPPGPISCGDGGTCTNTGGRPGCPTTDTMIPGTCPGTTLCCKPNAATPRQDAACTSAGGVCTVLSNGQCPAGQRVQAGLCTSSGSSIRCCIPSSSDPTPPPQPPSPTPPPPAQPPPPPPFGSTCVLRGGTCIDNPATGIPACPSGQSPLGATCNAGQICCR